MANIYVTMEGDRSLGSGSTSSTVVINFNLRWILETGGDEGSDTISVSVARPLTTLTVKAAVLDALSDWASNAGHTIVQFVDVDYQVLVVP